MIIVSSALLNFVHRYPQSVRLYNIHFICGTLYVSQFYAQIEGLLWTCSRLASGKILTITGKQNLATEIFTTGLEDNIIPLLYSEENLLY